MKTLFRFLSFTAGFLLLASLASGAPPGPAGALAMLHACALLCWVSHEYSRPRGARPAPGRSLRPPLETGPRVPRLARPRPRRLAA